MRKWIVSIVLLVCILGCTKEIDDQGRTTWKLDPNEVVKYEKPVEGAITILEVLTPFVPYAGTAVVALLTALGIWKGKIKPKLIEAQTEANLAHTATHTVVSIIEDIKTKQPDLWAKMKPGFIDSQMSTNIENVIRAIRRLPAKEREVER